MRALDTNILVYAEITSSARHDAAKRLLVELAEGDVPWAVPWPCIYEFLRVVTHPRVYHPPMPVELAQRELQALLASPTLVLLSETPQHSSILNRLLTDSKVTGNLMHDAHIAALCLEHGVSELLTVDRDFARFPELKSRDPF